MDGDAFSPEIEAAAANVFSSDVTELLEEEEGRMGVNWGWGLQCWRVPPRRACRESPPPWW